MAARLPNTVVSAPVIAALVLAFCATSCGRSPENKAIEFCAILSDSVGLYLSNPVTQMGYKIGTVKTIEPRDTEVKVGFTIDDKRAIPRHSGPRSPGAPPTRRELLPGSPSDAACRSD
ncbi:MlaD family protein [Mycobacterium timonense]